MTETPVLDGRTREEILERTKEIAPYYTDQWNPDSDDAGTVILEIFADLVEDVVERLDRVPEKHQMAFLDSLDFNTYPAQPSRLPVTFTVSEAATENVAIPTGTTVAAGETDERPEQRFETVDTGIEATPATLTDAYGVDPGMDWIVDHYDDLETGERTHLFVGENLQEHVFYMGDPELLTLSAGATVDLELATNAPESVLREYLEWEYYGERVVEPEDDDDEPVVEEGWHPLEIHGEPPRRVPRISEISQITQLLERLEPVLDRQGLVMIEREEFETLVRAIADDVRKGRFGTSDDGTVLPRNLLDVDDVDEPLVRGLRRQFSSLQDRFRAAATGDTFDAEAIDGDPVRLTFDVPGEPLECAVDDVEAKWLRCRIPREELSSALFSIVIDEVSLSVGGDEETGRTLTPDETFVNDQQVFLDGDDEVYPFGREPVASTTFSLACEEAFTKPGATVSITFENAHEPETEREDDDPEVAWQYWDGESWRRLAVSDETDALRESGSVSFEVPDDLETTAVMGHEHYWVRARFVRGHYGEARVEETDEHVWERITDHVHPPRFETVTISYEQGGEPFAALRCENTLGVRDVTTAEGTFRPFTAPPGNTQALYLGFDAPLRGGPIPVYLPLEGDVYPDGFTPWINVEYCSDPLTNEWTRLTARDGTEDFTERGILELVFPEETEAFELFGRERHWIRARVTGDEFARSSRRLFVSTDQLDGPGSGQGPLTAGAAGEPGRQREHSRTPPILYGIHLNTQWAENVRSVEDEVLGSSRDTAKQTFEFRHTPVMEPTVWVDEIESLSESERRTLERTQPERVDRVVRPDGTTTAFRVRWEEVEDFFESGPEDRHYVLDRTSGHLTFGDGRNGAIPPKGSKNVTASYRTGGGIDGDVEAGTVTDLKDSITFVDEVTNPEPGDGGEDEEPITELVSRAPKQLRDRGKPVTEDDFERIARSASRELATVSCKSGMDETGAHRPGYVTLLIVPETDQPKPIPSVDLTKRVEETMRERAPAVVVGEGRSRLTVRGPTYVETSVEATVEIKSAESVTDVKEQIEAELAAFIHPLSGGPEGDGWEIGSVPAPSVFAAHVEQLETVNRVERISVTFDDDGSVFTLADNERAPEVGEDVLIYSGRHDVTVTTGGGH
ncbi:putative baseplate assembly protein [Natronobiforma cellulositropha]|uniref:putative baseplate assembly protein n=1 Tax=Natronobiforma cellulositropha TaxID=1679076 RepID=UPI0021D61062|nr:putative baseplate assembly protein [Natronobiforma cellulositropha]